LGAAEVSEQAAAQRLGYVCRQLDLGTAGTLDILNAQISYREAQSSLISARAARYADTVALFQALGGGWWNKAPVSSASDR
jgi:outer membrane protein TolC